MEKKKEISWFIFTNDAFTNQVISRELPSENTFDDVRCFDGIERKLWRCSGQFVTKIRKNKALQNLHFDIFKREGRYGSIKKCDFFSKKNKKELERLRKKHSDVVDNKELDKVMNIKKSSTGDNLVFKRKPKKEISKIVKIFKSKLE